MLVLTAFSNFCKWYNSFLRIIWCLLEPFSCFYSFILLNLCVNFNPYIIFSDQLPVSTKFDMRSDPGVVRNYGRLLLEMASAVPDGIVCFFVSYSYMDGIVNSWHEMGILQVISFTWVPDIILWFFHRVAIIQIKSVLQLTGNDSNCVIVCSSASLWTDCHAAPLEHHEF